MRRNQPGFTLIELMLAMSFVAVLLISVAMLTIQISHLYARGLTMKEINQVGSQVANDLRVTVAAAYTEGVNIKQENGGNSGRKILCTGKYSYVMNDPQKIEDADNGHPASELIKYSNDSIVRLAKVRDESGSLCAPGAFQSPLNNDAVELLGAGDRSLVVRKLTIFPQPGDVAALNSTGLKSDFDAGRMLYTLHLTLGTGTNSEINDDQCKPPADVASGNEYCGVDTFTIVARVGNTYKN